MLAANTWRQGSRQLAVPALPPLALARDRRDTSSVPSYRSLKVSPELMRSSWRTVVLPYALPAKAGTYFSAASSSVVMWPRACAMPISKAVTLLAMEKDRKRASSRRP